MAFWNRKKRIGRLETHRDQVGAMCTRLLEASAIDFDKAPPLEQAVVGTFFFGMLTAHGMLDELSVPDIHALALIAYVENLHYSEQAAAQGIQACIDATKPENHPAMNAILHRGIDGHRQYIAEDIGGLSENIQSILRHHRK